MIGTDLSAIQPTPKVENCLFQKDDAESPWLFLHTPGEDCTSQCDHRIMFDYVHLRMVFTCFDDTRGVMRQAYENMNPGAWIEFQDIYFFDDAVKNPLQDLYDAAARGAATQGRDVRQTLKYKEWLEEVGCKRDSATHHPSSHSVFDANAPFFPPNAVVDVEQRRALVPCSPWPKDQRLKHVGLYQLENILDGIRGVCFKMVRLAGHTVEETESMIEDAKKFVADCRNHPYSWA